MATRHIMNPITEAISLIGDSDQADLNDESILKPLMIRTEPTITPNAKRA
jgi:hypothetical protein